MSNALPCAALLLVLGCGSPPAADPPAMPAPPATAAPAAAIVARFECEQVTLQATFDESRVALAMPERTITLPQVVSGSGARYSDGATIFWNKGNEATLEMNGATQQCRVLRDPWQEARDRGIDFRAVGQEPGWFLEIDQQREMRLLYDYAEREARAPAPPPITAGETTTWDAGRLRASSVDRPCSDAMSGEPFPRTVTVTIDGRALHGCGGPLTPP